MTKREPRRCITCGEPITPLRAMQAVVDGALVKPLCESCYQAGWSQGYGCGVTEGLARAEHRLGAVAEVRALHRHGKRGPQEPYCWECKQPWPCPTVAALDEAGCP